MRRHLLTLALCGLATLVQAQSTWPDKPITMIVPFPPGGVADTVARPVELYDGDAFLLCDAPSDSNHYLTVSLFEFLYLSQQTEELMFRFLSNTARIDKNKFRIFRSSHYSVLLLQDSSKFPRVVFIHLTAECLDVHSWLRACILRRWGGRMRKR